MRVFQPFTEPDSGYVESLQFAVSGSEVQVVSEPAADIYSEGGLVSSAFLVHLTRSTIQSHHVLLLCVFIGLGDIEFLTS